MLMHRQFSTYTSPDVLYVYVSMIMIVLSVISSIVCELHFLFSFMLFYFCTEWCYSLTCSKQCRSPSNSKVPCGSWCRPVDHCQCK